MVKPITCTLLLCAPLLGCETLHHYVYNMTACPIQVTYSVAAIRNNTVLVEPGKWVGSLGAGANRLDHLTIVAVGRVPHDYSQADLAKLRPRFAPEDRFGWFDDGLRYLPSEPKTFPATDQPCGDH
jgi:hypothetical protein